MKTLLAAFASITVSLAQVYGAAVTLNLSAGQLSLPDGQPIPDGSLIQLVVSTADTSFTTPSALSFVGGSADDVVVASFAMNSASGGAPGVFSRPIILEYNNTFDGKTIAAGMPMMLRWWPNLTTASNNPSSDPLRVLGEFRRDSIDDFSEINWTLPGAPSTKSLNVLTSAFGGNTPASSLRAAPVPEPTSAAMLIVGALALVSIRRRL